MSLTQAQLNILAQGGDIDFGLPEDPGLSSADGIFFENVFFQTPTGDQSSTPQGLTELEVLNDLGNFQQTNTSLVVRNSSLTVGDDLGSTSGADSIISLSGSDTIVTLTGEAMSSNSSTRLRLAAEAGDSSTATLFISDGAQVNVDNVNGSLGRGIDIGVNFGAFQSGGTFFAGGQSIDATLVIEGNETVVSVDNSSGDRGDLGIARIDRAEDGLTDTTTNRSANGLGIIRDGAEVNIHQSIIIADANNIAGATANGSLLIEGEDTSVTVGNPAGTSDGGFMRIAEEGGTGSLVIRDGAELTLLAGDEFGGGIQLSGGSDRAGGEATLIATGDGTRIAAEQGTIFVGRNGGNSSFTASDGASIETQFFSSGFNGSGETVFEGAGTSLSLSGAQVVPGFGAFLTVGSDIDGSFIVRDGADVTITGDGGEFPGFQAGRNDGGQGVITVTGEGSTITIDGANNVDSGGGETGFIRAGRDANSDGTINIFDGGVITNDPSGLLIVAQNVGSTGTVNVDGAGSLFDFGSFARLSDDTPGDEGGESVVTISDGGLFRGGDIENSGILNVASGGQIDADLTVVTALGSIDISDATVVGDIELFGRFEIAGDGVGTANVDGDFLTETTSTIAIDITDYSGGVGDTLTVTGAGNFDEGVLELNIEDALDVGVGQTFTLATVSNGITLTTNIVEEVSSGREFEVSQIGMSVVLTALALVEATEGDDVLTGTAGADFLDGLGGNDTIDGFGGVDTLLGGGGADTLRGADGNDRLFGQGGDDVLEGGAGADILNGSAGIDTASYELSFEAVQIDLRLMTASGGEAAGDTFFSIENLIGSEFGDTLFGGNEDSRLEGGLGADTLQGNLGNDVLIGGGGADFLGGGTGLRDVADYSDSINAVDVGVDVAAVNLGGDAQGDTLLGVEDLIGTSLSDQLTGNSVRNELIGGSGDDTLNGGDNNDTLLGGENDDTLIGGRGVDVIDGGAGSDTASYSNSDLRITVDLVAGTANGSGHGSGDVLTSIENIIGSLFNDALNGDGDANEINGFNGNDTILGLGGDDFLLGGNGNDSINGGTGDDLMSGGAGIDTFVFDTLAWGADRISAWQDGSDLLDFTAVGLDFSDFTEVTVGSSTRLDYTLDPTQSVLLLGVNAADIDANDFV